MSAPYRNAWAFGPYAPDGRYPRSSQIFATEPIHGSAER